MSNDLISVIVPVYKAEQYIPRCVESLLEQTYTNLQIILVDDGSPDNSPEICDQYALRDSRIQVIHKNNGGASSARNVGLDAAIGSYICFVDSDDYLPQNSIESLYIAIKRYDCQYAAGVCQIAGRNKYKNKIGRLQIMDYCSVPEAVLEYITQPGSYSPYAKIYQADIFRKYSIRYDETLKCSEDALLVRQFLRRCSRICLIPDVVYFYNTENNNSLSKKGYPDYGVYYAEKMRALECLVNVLPLSDDRREKFLTERAVHGLYISIKHYSINFEKQEERSAYLDKTVSELSSWLWKAEVTRSFYLRKWWGKNFLTAHNRDFKSISVSKHLLHDGYGRLRKYVRLVLYHVLAL